MLFMVWQASVCTIMAVKWQAILRRVVVSAEFMSICNVNLCGQIRRYPAPAMYKTMDGLSTKLVTIFV